MGVALPAVVVVALLIFSWLAWKISKLHMHASIQSQCIADMLVEPDAEKRLLIAEDARLAMIENGTWKAD